MLGWSYFRGGLKKGFVLYKFDCLDIKMTRALKITKTLEPKSLPGAYQPTHSPEYYCE